VLLALSTGCYAEHQIQPTSLALLPACCIGHRSAQAITVIVRNSDSGFQTIWELEVDPSTQQASAKELLKRLELSWRFGPGSLEREGVEASLGSGTRLVDGATYVWYPPPGQWYLPPGKATRFCRHWCPALPSQYAHSCTSCCCLEPPTHRLLPKQL
jgi:hypothetical protein